MSTSGVAGAPLLPLPETPAADGVVCLPEGLPGFPYCRRFVVASSEELAPLTCLQGLDEDRPAFLAVDPRLVLPSYEATLSPADRARLDASADETLLWLALVHMEQDRVFINLQAPIVINPSRMYGLQVIDTDGPYTTHHELMRG